MSDHVTKHRLRTGTPGRALVVMPNTADNRSRFWRRSITIISLLAMFAGGLISLMVSHGFSVALAGIIGIMAYLVLAISMLPPFPGEGR